MQLPIEEHADGVLVMVKAVPGGPHNVLRLGRDGRVRAVVTQVAEKGKANSAVIALFAKSLRLSKSQIGIVRGVNARAKTLLVKNVSIGQLAEKLRAALENSD